MPPALAERGPKMNKTIVTTIAAVAVLAMSVTAFAQNAGPRGAGQPGQGGGGRMMMMGPRAAEIQEKVLTTIGATADQKTKIKALNEKMRTATENFWKNELKMPMPQWGGRQGGNRQGGNAQGGNRQGGGNAQGQRGQGGNRQGMPQLSEEQRGKLMTFMQNQQKSHQAEMTKILGQAKFTEYQKEMRAEMQKMRQQQRPGGGQNPPRGQKPPL